MTTFASKVTEVLATMWHRTLQTSPVWLVIYCGGWVFLLAPGWEWVGLAWVASATIALAFRT